MTEHFNHYSCKNCGQVGIRHNKERVYPDDGPVGSWHYHYLCPDGSGRHYQIARAEEASDQ